MTERSRATNAEVLRRTTPAAPVGAGGAGGAAAAAALHDRAVRQVIRTTHQTCCQNFRPASHLLKLFLLLLLAAVRTLRLLLLRLLAGVVRVSRRRRRDEPRGGAVHIVGPHRAALV